MNSLHFYMTYQNLNKEYSMFYSQPKYLENLLWEREINDGQDFFTNDQIEKLSRLFKDERFDHIFKFVRQMRMFKINYDTYYNNPDLLEELLKNNKFSSKQLHYIRCIFNSDYFRYIFEIIKVQKGMKKLTF